MGYRTYIGRIKKDKYQSIKDLSKRQLFKKFGEEWSDDEYENYLGVYDIVDETLYELGKYVEEFGKDYRKPFFTNKKLQKEYDTDNEIYLCSKEFFGSIVEMYSSKVRKNYSTMLAPFFLGGGRNFERSDFLSSVDMGYDSTTFENTYKFDFSKITDEEQTQLHNIISHVRSMGLEWGINAYVDDVRPYNLEQGDSVTNSSKYEYAVFEMVQLYKSFDWENYELVYYGY